MPNSRALVLLCLLPIVACAPSIRGQVLLDTSSLKDAKSVQYGVPGLPIELYLVKANTANPKLTALVETSKPIEAKDADLPDDPYGDTSTTEETKKPAQVEYRRGQGTKVLQLTSQSDGSFYFGSIDPGEYEVRIGDAAWDQGYRLVNSTNPAAVTVLFSGAHVNFTVTRQGLVKVGGACPATVTFPQAMLCEQFYQNTNPVPLHNVTITAELSKNIGASPLYDGAYDSSSTVAWVYPNVAPNEVIKAGFVIVPHIPAGEVETVDITWKVASTNDPTSTTLAETSTNISAKAGVTLTIDGPASLQPTKKETLTVTWDNTGSRPLHDAVLVLTLAEGVTYASSAPQGTFDKVKRTVTWKIDAIDVKEAQDVECAVLWPLHVATEQPLTFHAELSNAALTAPVVANDLELTVVPTINLTLDVSHFPKNVGVGDAMSWTMVLEQQGAVGLHHVKVVATLDALMMVSNSGGGTKSQADHTLTWELASLAAQQKETIAFSVKQDKGTEKGDTLTLTVTVTADDVPETAKQITITLDD